MQISQKVDSRLAIAIFSSIPTVSSFNENTLKIGVAIVTGTSSLSPPLRHPFQSMVDTATEQKLLAGLERLREAISAGQDGGWTAIERFTDFASRVEPHIGERIIDDNPHLLDDWRSVAPLYASYMQDKERDSAGSGWSFLAGPGAERYDEFADQSYRRVKDMFDVVDFSSCRRFVMVGCGPLPVTILHVLAKTDVPSVVGLDVNSATIETVRTNIKRLDLKRFRALHADGGTYSYESADVIYVANLVSPKAATLTRIAESARSGTPVIVREPISFGRLIADRGLDACGELFMLRSVGIGNKRFLSRHVFSECY